MRLRSEDNGQVETEFVELEKIEERRNGKKIVFAQIFLVVWIINVKQTILLRLFNHQHKNR